MILNKFIKSIYRIFKKEKKKEKHETKLYTNNEEIKINYDKNIINNNLNNENNIEIKKNILENKLNYIKDTKNIQDIKTITVPELKNKLNTIWDILKIKENTQAEHIIKSIPSDTWVNMDEIRQRIKLEFNIEYKNDKSLYPYLKTLTDINLIKINNTGKKRSWKKSIIVIKLENINNN